MPTQMEGGALRRRRKLRAPKRKKSAHFPTVEIGFRSIIISSSCARTYAEKWNYVVNNPVRHGYVVHAEDWRFQAELNVLSWHD
jgi:hypothetical protein